MGERQPTVGVTKEGSQLGVRRVPSRESWDPARVARNFSR